MAQSRNEKILRAIIDGTEYTAPPQSRIEALLIELLNQGGGGGGGDGTLRVTLSEDPDTGDMMADKTSEEVTEAIDAGKLPYIYGPSESIYGGPSIYYFDHALYSGDTPVCYFTHKGFMQDTMVINSYAIGPDGSAYFESYSVEVTKDS